jgi:predicted MFS family arabinose efflux permease
VCLCLQPKIEPGRLSVPSADTPATRLATRLAFLVAGYGIACWAPLVPYVQSRLAVDNAVFGLLLLCLGVGSVGAMLLTGYLATTYGSRPIVVAGALGMSLLLPVLTLSASPAMLALTLLLFGASLGSLDVAMNIHAIQVERDARQPLMSGFHALFSLGGLAGSLVMTLLLTRHLPLLACSVLCASIMLFATLLAWPRLLSEKAPQSGPVSVLPRGIVLLLAVLASIAFLAEGAVLDWGALLLSSIGLLAVEHSGLGYVMFSVAMTIGRLGGDRIVARYGDRVVLLGGSLLAVVGFILVLTAPIALMAIIGFLAIGFGASNVVPVLFGRAGSQRVMPVGLAVSAITTIGYAGVLVGPGVIGLVAKAVGLRGAFVLLAVLFSCITLLARSATRDASETEPSPSAPGWQESDITKDPGAPYPDPADT